MKTINLFFDFEFTSLSPDAQPISLGIVSDDKSFYAEFSDFDINRCDDWVKENVVSKLNHKHSEPFCTCDFCGETVQIKVELKQWLAQFSDYQIQFICDCGYMDWYWMLQLLAEWDICQTEFVGNNGYLWHTTSTVFYKTGLPKLPANISPVPQDLNDLIAIKDGISTKEAFELNREELALSWYVNEDNPEFKNPNKHNALWDAEVIKEIYNKFNHA